MTTQAFLDMLNELALSASLLIHNDTRGAVDFGFLLAVALLASSLGLLHIVGALEAADESGVSLLALALSETRTLGPLHLSFGVALGAFLQSGQSQLNGGW